MAHVEHWRTCEVCRRRRGVQLAGGPREEELLIVKQAIGETLRPCREALAFLGRPGCETSVKLLVACLVRWSSRHDTEAMRQFADALVAVGPEAVEPVGRLLANVTVEARVRLPAVEVLGRIGGVPARVALLKTLALDDVALRIEVATVLGRYGDESVLPALCSRLRDHYLGVREAASAALVQLAHPSAFPHLVEVIREGDPMAQRLAALPLACTDNPDAIPVLNSILGEPVAGVRSTVAQALSRFGEAGAAAVLTRKEGVKFLRGFLLDPEPAVREWAALGLGLTLDREQLALLRRRLWRFAGEDEPSVREILRRAVEQIEQHAPDLRGLPRSGNGMADPAGRPRKGWADKDNDNEKEANSPRSQHAHEPPVDADRNGECGGKHG